MTEAAAEARCSMRWRFVSSPPCTNSEYHLTQKGVCVDCNLPITWIGHYFAGLIALLHPA